MNRPRGAFWIAVYLTLVLAPVLALLIGPTPPGRGFWWEFAIAIGFAATTMMGVQFVLTARFRRAAAPFGIDIVYYFHRYLALVAVGLVLAHVLVLLVVEPVLLGLLAPWQAPAYITAGLASVVAVLLLVGVSLGRKRFGIRYETWRWTHGLLAILVICLALVHIWGVGYYVAVPWKRALWVGIAASWVAILGYVRVVKPWRLMRRPYRVAELRPERGDAWTMVVAPVGHTGFSFHAGQFAWVTVGRSPYTMSEHPFSISSPPASGGELAFAIKELGDFTGTVGQIPLGERVCVDGPHGAFTVDAHAATGYVFVAGGIGIAPIMSMLRALADAGDTRPLTLVYAYRRWERLTFREAIDELKTRLSLSVIYVLAEPPEGWSGEHGLVSEALLDRHLPPERAELQYLVCGPVPMIDVVERALYQLGIPLDRVHSELFDLV
ncbi:MAG: ferric reductase-like transmembrane domain-containing protein [Gemmatimonadaceae bacterium]|nr:ferric reductase-like transmembrane domain-containing protein [Gemmatimonadaceae bacterium]